MIKLINTILFTIASIIIISSPSYAEQKIRNLSLSVEETNKFLATPQEPKKEKESLEEIAGFKNGKNPEPEKPNKDQIDNEYDDEYSDPPFPSSNSRNDIYNQKIR